MASRLRKLKLEKPSEKPCENEIARGPVSSIPVIHVLDDLLAGACRTEDRAAQQCNAPVDISANQLAFIQYTSGSTSAPKGVMITHGNLQDNLQQIKDKLQNTPADIGITWLPP